MPAILVIDIGKTNAKLGLVDRQSGSLIETFTRDSRVVDRPPYPHLDTEGLWKWIVEHLAQAAALAHVECIAVTAHGAAAALVTDDALALPVIDYEFEGPDASASRYDALCSSFTETYSPKLPAGLNVGRQLFWQREQFPEQFARARALLPYPQYWTWRLTGRKAAEVTSLGAHTDLWNPIAREVSSFARREGFDRLIPQVLPADAVLGTLRADLCERSGLDPLCQVLVGIHDSNASLVPYLHSFDEPFTVVSTGTWVISFAVGSPLDTLVPERDCIANVNLRGDPVACSRFMGGREFAVLADGATAGAARADVERLLDDDIFALPSFTRTGGPFQGREGEIVATRPLSRSDRPALASLYAALVTDVALDLCGSRGDIIFEGAFARNDLIMAIVGALRPSQPVYCSADTTGTTTGTAMLASASIAVPPLARVARADATLEQRLRDYRASWLARI